MSAILRARAFASSTSISAADSASATRMSSPLPLHTPKRLQRSSGLSAAPFGRARTHPCRTCRRAAHPRALREAKSQQDFRGCGRSDERPDSPGPLRRHASNHAGHSRLRAAAKEISSGRGGPRLRVGRFSSAIGRSRPFSPAIFWSSGRREPTASRNHRITMRAAAPPKFSSKAAASALPESAKHTTTSSAANLVKRVGTEHQLMPLFPAFLKLAGRRCLVIGAGPIAAGKNRKPPSSGGERSRGSARRHGSHSRLGPREKIRWDARKFCPSDFKASFSSSPPPPRPRCTHTSSGKRGAALSCATWWTTPRTAISTTARWSAAARSKSPSPPAAIALLSRSACENNLKGNLPPSTKTGSKISPRRANDYSRNRFHRSGGRRCCTVLQAKFRSRIFAARQGKENESRAMVLTFLTRESELNQ